MLLLTRLNGHPMAINGDLIKSVESSPDTMITLITGEKVVVRETLETVIDAAHDWRVHVLRDTLANTDVSAEVAEVAHLVAVNGTAASACVAHHSKMHAVSEHHSK